MTNKYLTGAYPGGYTVANTVTYLDIESTAFIGGNGVIGSSTAPHTLQITNNGTVHATSGNAIGISIYYERGYKTGNSITNGNSNPAALIEGDYDGIYAANATITNFGTIKGLTSSGISCVNTTVTNFGTIEGLGGSYRSRGVNLGPSCTVTNGSSTDTQALIEGYVGIIGTGSVSNFGTIIGTNDPGVFFSSNASNSVTVTNGSQSDRAATIQGASAGVLVRNTIGTVTNWGTISTGGNKAVALLDGGLTNNFGAISSASGVGISLTGSARVVNGSSQDTAASITGVAAGIANQYTTTLPATVVNYGTVQTTGSSGYGVLLRGDQATIVNYGTIIGGSAGVGLFGKHDVLINGSSTNAAALIGGGVSVASGEGDTVVNFGTISGLTLSGAHEVLRVEAGCVFESLVHDAGTLSLVNGVGMLSNLTGGSVVVSGSMAAATFSGFRTLEIDKSARFTVMGNATIAQGQTLSDQGVLTVAGALVIAGAAQGGGVIGLAAHAAAMFETAVPAGLTVSFQGGDSVLALQDPAAFAATIAGFDRRGTIDLVGIFATAAVLGAGDRLTITNNGQTIATLQLAGAFGGDTFAETSDGRAGTLITVSRTSAAPQAPVVALPAPHAFIAAAASFGAIGGAAHPTAVAHYAVWRPTLSAPRAMVA